MGLALCFVMLCVLTFIGAGLLLSCISGFAPASGFRGLFRSARFWVGLVLSLSGALLIFAILSSLCSGLL